jgi:thioredoxin reductase (NADPH)
MATDFDLIVIGEGVTGLTAAGAAARAGRRVATYEATLFGGLVINVNELHGDVPEGATSGTDYAAGLMTQNSELGVESRNEEVTGLEAAGGVINVLTAGGRATAQRVIVASGARLKPLGVPGEAEFEHRGVSHCADCDGPLYADAEVVVVGGGDSAVQEALVLAQFARTVHLVHRGGALTARTDFIAQVQASGRILVHWHTVVEKIEGGEGVEKVVVRDTQAGTTRELAATGFFAYVGLAPNSGFLPAAVKRDNRGGIVTDAALATTLPGIFAAGAVRAGYDGRLVTAVAEGEAAARAACAGLAD